MKCFKKCAVLAAVVLLCACLGGCGKYASSYVTTMMVRTAKSKEVKVSFSTLKGTLVEKLKCDGKEGRELKYSAELGTGTIKVYYDIDGTKEELFTITGGEKIEDSLGELKKGTIHIFLETDGKAEDGKFEFKIE